MNEREQEGKRIGWTTGTILNSWLSVPYSKEGKQEKPAEVNSHKNEELDLSIFGGWRGGDIGSVYARSIVFSHVIILEGVCAYEGEFMWTCFGVYESDPG